MIEVKVLIVEDEPPIAQEISYNLKDNGYDVVGIAYTAEKALDMLYTNKVDVILLDISLKGPMNGIELANIINKKYQIPFIFITSFSDDLTIGLAAETYPDGYIVKPFKDDDIAPVIKLAMVKSNFKKNNRLPSNDKINRLIKVPITKSEYKIIQLLLEGKKNREIAADLFLSVNTIKTHLSNIYKKLNVHSKPHLINFIQGLS